MFEALKIKRNVTCKHSGALTTLWHCSSLGVTLGTMLSENMKASVSLLEGTVLQPTSVRACMACASAHPHLTGEERLCLSPHLTGEERLIPGPFPAALSSHTTPGAFSAASCDTINMCLYLSWGQVWGVRQRTDSNAEKGDFVTSLPTAGRFQFASD